MRDTPVETIRSKKHPLTILLIEDDEGLSVLFQQALAGAGLPFEWACSGREGIDKVAGRGRDYLVLLDYSLPDMKAAALIEALATAGEVPPFIVITGHGDERVAVEMMRLGALDYLVKDAHLLDRLPGVVDRVLREIKMRQTLVESEMALQRNMRELAAIYDHMPTIMLLLDEDCRLRKANSAAARFFGKSAEALIGLRLGEAIDCLHSKEGECGSSANCGECIIRRHAEETYSSGQSHRQVEARFSPAASHEGGVLYFLLSTDLLSLDDKRCVLVSLEDITERKRLEDEFRQAQKMEAVGQLAGGVAHDFNNILCVITMHIHMLRTNPSAAPEIKQQLSDVETEAKRAANLTRQLLLFSRRQAMRFEPIELNALIDHLLKMLRRILGEQIAMSFDAECGAMTIQGDSGVIEQVVMNLCVNARDAMPQGGCLKIKTSIVELDADAVRAHSQARAGRFVCLSVSDTGCGMDEATQKRIFEPFFTTKPVGKGTGLGLASAYGIVKEHQGWIEVQSASGQGSTFRVFLPACEKTESDDVTPAVEAIQGGGETILVVEDDPGVRMLVKLCLKGYGYEILEAGTGAEAEAIWLQHRDRIGLVFTDMVMPGGMSGLELASRLLEDKASLQIIIGSGYNDEMVKNGVPTNPQMVFLSKPYEPEALLSAVRKCLDR
jgi:PAS domain S-box-containing protein